jgi:hypothetical protein
MIGYVPSRYFPRQVSLEPNGRVLLVTIYGGGELETVNVHVPMEFK